MKIRTYILLTIIALFMGINLIQTIERPAWVVAASQATIAKKSSFKQRTNAPKTVRFDAQVLDKADETYNPYKKLKELTNTIKNESPSPENQDNLFSTCRNIESILSHDLSLQFLPEEFLTLTNLRSRILRAQSPEQAQSQTQQFIDCMHDIGQKTKNLI